MENATKALLIAAAVLIAILIISLGLVIYNKATEAANNAGDLGEAEMQQRNEKFPTYKTYRVKCYIGENTKRIRKIDIWEND